MGWIFLHCTSKRIDCLNFTVSSNCHIWARGKSVDILSLFLLPMSSILHFPLRMERGREEREKYLYPEDARWFVQYTVRRMLKINLVICRKADSQFKQQEFYTITS